MRYQLRYSRHFPATKDRATRQRKAIKILRALTGYLGRADLRGLTCLDLGCSVGVISHLLASAGAVVVGLDIDEEALHESRAASPGPGFLIGDAGAAPFPEGAFDVVICSQVYEHVPSLGLLVWQIYRLLKTGGVCFFSGPNRWAIIEEHYGLPFLSWLPKRWADRYVRFAGRAEEYYERPRSAGELRQALRGFIIHDITPDLLRDPERYAMQPEAGPFKHIARLIPAWGWPLVGVVVPNFNWLLVKDAP